MTNAHVLRSYRYGKRDLPRMPHTPVRRFTAPGAHQDSRRRNEQQRPEQTAERTYAPAADFAIVDVARAATAAPFYFDPIDIKGVIFEDGGLRETNNPTMVGVEEIQCIHGPDFIGTVVSVGTARGPPKTQSKVRQIRDTIRSKLVRITNMSTDPDIVHRNAEPRVRQVGGDYFRLNPRRDTDLLSIPLDEWEPRSRWRNEMFSASEILPGQRTVREMDAAFNIWALHSDVHQEMEDCAWALVDIRRARTRDAAKWERFAVGSEFSCQLDNAGVDECSHTFMYRNVFEEHLKEHHNLGDADISRRADIASERSKFTYQEAART